MLPCGCMWMSNRLGTARMEFGSSMMVVADVAVVKTAKRYMRKTHRNCLQPVAHLPWPWEWTVDSVCARRVWAVPSGFATDFTWQLLELCVCVSVCESGHTFATSAFDLYENSKLNSGQFVKFPCAHAAHRDLANSISSIKMWRQLRIVNLRCRHFQVVFLTVSKINKQHAHASFSIICLMLFLSFFSDFCRYFFCFFFFCLSFLQTHVCCHISIAINDCAGSGCATPSPSPISIHSSVSFGFWQQTSLMRRLLRGALIISQAWAVLMFIHMYLFVCVCVCATPSAARPESRLLLLALIVVFFLSPSPPLSFLCWRNLRPEIMSKVTQFSKQYRTAEEEALWTRKGASPPLQFICFLVAALHNFAPKHLSKQKTINSVEHFMNASSTGLGTHTHTPTAETVSGDRFRVRIRAHFGTRKSSSTYKWLDPELSVCVRVWLYFYCNQI